MAFDILKMGVVTGGKGASFSTWHYLTDSNARATVDNANYFVHTGLKVGDHIMANCSDGTIALRVKTVASDGSATTQVMWQSA